MSTTRKRYTSEFKVQVVLEVLSNTATLTEIASKHALHPTMISTWKTECLEKTKDAFSDPRKKDDALKEKEADLDEAHRQIGQLTIERDWMKKNIDSLEACDHSRRLTLIDVNFTFLSISRQVELLGISRSTYYYVPVIDPERESILKRLDALYTDHPFLGARRMSMLLKTEGYSVGRHKAIKLMQILGIQPIYPHKNTSIPNKEHKMYPYLLRNLPITHANQVWSTDYDGFVIKFWLKIQEFSSKTAHTFFYLPIKYLDLIHPLGVPFVSFGFKFRDNLDARIHISSNPLGFFQQIYFE